MKRKCIGCGAILQTIDSEKIGYIDEEILKRDGQVYCKRCFRLKHYNQNIDVKLDHNNDFSEIKEKPGLIVNIIDLFNLDGAIIPNINNFFDSDNIILVFNKFDLYSKSINRNKLRVYLQEYCDEKQIKYKDLMIISSFKKNDIIDLINKIGKYRNNQNVYFVGITNVGKSSIINQILSIFTNNKDLITVSNTINTTLGNIYIPLEDGGYLVDTPGIIKEDSLHNYISKDTLDNIVPKKIVNPKSYQLNPKQTLFIGGFARIDFLEGEKSSFVTYFKNELVIHRTKLENADSFYQQHFQDILKYPLKDEIKLLGDKKNYHFSFTKDSKIDIVISGLGHVAITGVGKIKVTTFSNINIIKRKAMI
ncbi:MAG TPA: ribosome biogenesis GTPase YqeH [Acholeplasmataceae bacterium]|nr:ribosome biogenesis GTPase YqeH [Acholeplasmataceae bacterium]